MRYAIGIEYDGSGFCGWQAQRDDPSVQESVEQAVSRVADTAVRLVCAGRTDTGVHALAQVAHFDSPAQRENRQWVLGVNRHLPASVCLLWARPVADDFHARFSAVERSYRYVILNRAVRPALRAGQVAWCHQALDTEAMDRAAQPLRGEHDFSAFRSAGCQATHAVREITRIGVSRDGENVFLDVSANGFLYHMVRNIAGSLLDVGRGERSVDWIAELLAGRDRTRAGATADAAGLYFAGVRYPERFGLPGPPCVPGGVQS
ncbi:MAG: tRNA pseudouridine(38-40) synthase TruA [Xanthomonadales bacterium]|nr:tRNA pseudouridine(38-40) synthase TruA [Xanthomonadales bacterium]